MISGIYCFENIINLNRYAGQAWDIDKRRKEHLYRLNSNTPSNNIYFQNAWNKYGAENFKFWIVEQCVIELLNEREIFWIKELHSHFTERGYNISWGGDAPMRGIKMSDESRKKMSENHADVFGENNPNFGNTGKNSPLFGKILSDEIRKKQSDNHADFSGKNNPMFGKHASDETKQKQAAARKSYWKNKKISP